MFRKKKKAQHYLHRIISPLQTRQAEGGHQAAQEQGMSRGGIVADCCLFPYAFRMSSEDSKGQVPSLMILRREGRATLSRQISPA